MSKKRAHTVTRNAGLFLGLGGIALLVLQLGTTAAQSPFWFWTALLAMLVGGGLFSLAVSGHCSWN